MFQGEGTVRYYVNSLQQNMQSLQQNMKGKLCDIAYETATCCNPQIHSFIGDKKLDCSSVEQQLSML
jgi:hypothetical protein